MNKVECLASTISSTNEAILHLQVHRQPLGNLGEQGTPKFLYSGA